MLGDVARAPFPDLGQYCMTGSAIASVVVAVALAAAPMLPGSLSRASAQPNSHGFAEPGQRHDPSQPTAGEKVIVKAGLFDWLFGGSARATAGTRSAIRAGPTANARRPT